jgi:hypothetical protein
MSCFWKTFFTYHSNKIFIYNSKNIFIFFVFFNCYYFLSTPAHETLAP